MSYEVESPLNRCPSHPGGLLKDLIKDSGKSMVEIASMLDMSRQHLYDICNGEADVSVCTALKLGKLFGNGPMLWVNMMNAHDIWRLEHDIDFSNIEPIIFEK